MCVETADSYVVGAVTGMLRIIVTKAFLLF